MLHICTLSILFIAFPVMVFAETVGVFFDSNEAQIKFAANDVKSALESKGFKVEMNELSKLKTSYPNKKIVIAIEADKKIIKLFAAEGGTGPTGLGEQAYALQTTTQKQNSYWVFGGDVNGAMYGGLQIAENITFEGLSGTYNEKVSPDFKQRGVKLNLPMDRRIPTYSGYMGNTSTQHAVKNVWDMKFWEAWADSL